MSVKRSLAPNLMTVFNLLLGFLAIIFITKNRFTTSAWLIVIAGICDFFDGKIARATDSSSDFGIEFDSLADIVSFGVAPAFLIYSVQMGAFEPVGILISFLPLVAGAIRLARFNASEPVTEKHQFEGLPIPAGAGLICTYVIFSHHFWGAIRFPALTITLLLSASILMVSTIEFDALPKLSFRKGRKNTLQILTLFLAIALIVIFLEKAMFPLILAYIIAQIGRALWHFIRDDEDETLPDVSVSKH